MRLRVNSLFRKAICICMIVFITTATLPAESLAGYRGCRAKPDTAIKILMEALKSSQNVFPIRLGGIEIIGYEGDDYNSAGSSPICICKMPPPIFIRVGLTFSMWEAAHLVETVKHPWCSPSVGMEIPLPWNSSAVGGESVEEGENTQSASAQVHVIIYPLWILVGLFLDVVCFQYAKSFDYLYITEIDPLWQNDMWATLLGPEAFLVANPITQAICSVDTIAATAQRPMDLLFWCMGAWGSTYPMSENLSSSGYVQAQAGLAARMVAKLHRELLLWGTIGSPTVSGWCQRYIMPMWIKKQYNLQLLYPKSFNVRKVIGKPGLFWSSGKNPPWKGDDFVWMLYNKRDCCLF